MVRRFFLKRSVAVVAVLACTLSIAAVRAVAAEIFVRAGGDDSQSGTSPQSALRTIRAAAARAAPGDRIIVGPGTYVEGDITPQTWGLVTFLADSRGRYTGDAPGPVLVDASGFGTGFRLNGHLEVTIDGFFIRGARGNGVLAKTRSDKTSIANCVIFDSGQEGIQIQDSPRSFVFNSLVYNNGGSGILITGQVTGSPGCQIVNNTVYGNGDRGIFIAGTETARPRPSPNCTVLNNISVGNGSASLTGIQVNPASAEGYRSGGNFADRYPTGTPVDATDRTTSLPDILFVDPDGPDDQLGGEGFADDNFRLFHQHAGEERTSPAVDAGSAPARKLSLSRATTRTDQRGDRGFVDAGYHYGNTGPIPERAGGKIRRKNIYVSPAGSDDNDGATLRSALATIAHALEQARVGHRIILLSGTYHEGDVEVALSGRVDRPIIIEGWGAPVLDATAAARGVRIIDRTDVILRGLTVRGASDGIWLRRGQRLTIQDCSLLRNRSRGIYVDGATAVRIARTSVSENGTHGVAVNGGEVTLENVSLVHNDGSGLFAIGGTATVRDSSICSNALGVTGTGGTALVMAQSIVCANTRDGLRLTTGSADLRAIEVVDNGRDGVSARRMEALTVSKATVARNGGNGIEIQETPDASVRHSRVYSNAGNGALVLDSASLIVFNNLVYANGSTGLRIKGTETGSRGAQVLNNTVYGNAEYGVAIGGSDLEPPSTESLLLRNIIQGNTKAGLQVTPLSLDGYRGDYNVVALPIPYGPFTPPGLHDLIVLDAGLLAPAGPDGVLGGYSSDDDFRLDLRSPAVDAGGIDVSAAGLAGLTTRADGVPDSGMVDLGYHYDPSALPPL